MSFLRRARGILRRLQSNERSNEQSERIHEWSKSIRFPGLALYRVNCSRPAAGDVQGAAPRTRRAPRRGVDQLEAAQAFGAARPGRRASFLDLRLQQLPTQLFHAQ